ncbi:MAG: nodulation protein NfeD [Bacillus sp. (in: firmicutes)]
MRKRFPLFLLLLLLATCLLPFQTQAKEEVVYVAPLEDTVESGLYAFLERAISVAEENGATAIIFKINTPGGLVSAAEDIGKLFSDTSIKTIAWVDNRALSAGAYIALNADQIYMAPGSTMGSAAIITSSGNAADEKSQSAWLAAMESAAEKNGRDPRYAMAMADATVELPEGLSDGSLLTLTEKSAFNVGYSEGTVSNLDGLLAEIGLENAEVRDIEETFVEKLARFLTNPVVIPFLLTIGILGLVIELFSPGFGIPGGVGITSLILYFFGHMVAGFVGYEALLLFIIGLIFILLEFFVPGGILGILGLSAVVGSLFMAGENNTLIAVSLLIAIMVSLTVSILLVKVFNKNMKFFKKMVLKDATTTEEGYVSNVNRVELLGKIGTALTPLRPAGIASFNDERVDVVTEGSFIDQDSEVIVVKVEGSRIVVREKKS